MCDIVVEGKECPQCGYLFTHVDTLEESTAKVKADPKVEEYLEGIKEDTRKGMKVEAKKGKVK
jgi:transcriptional regulator NrdR family protein